MIDGLAAELGSGLPRIEDASLRPLLATLAREAESPLRGLSALRETFLRFLPELDESGAFILRINPSQRKRTGSYYTPWCIALWVAESALEPFHDQSEPPMVFDPSMGAGIFLLAAFRAMQLRWAMSSAELAEQKLCGIDLDPLAIRVATVGLALEAGARPEALARTLVVGDPLAGDVTHLHPQVVIGNPPWGAHLAEDHPKKTDSFKRFLTLGASMTHGSLGMIVPHAILLQSTHADVRAGLLHRFAPRHVMLLGDGLFPGVAAPACALVFGPKPGPPDVRVTDLRNHSECLEYHVPSSRWTEAGFVAEGGARWDLLQRLQSGHPSLGDLRAQYRVRDTGLNYSHAAIATRSLYRAPHPDDSRDHPVYRGRGFNRYTAVTSDAWLRHDAVVRLRSGERLSVGWPTMHTPEKIVFRQTADRLVATLDSTQMVMGRSVLAITAETNASLPALLACINSRLLTFLYRVLAGEEGRVLPQVKVGRVLALPIPAIAAFLDPIDTDCADGMLWGRLHSLALHQLSLGTPHPAVDREIDTVVESLYGLTEEEKSLLNSLGDKTR